MFEPAGVMGEWWWVSLCLYLYSPRLEEGFFATSAPLFKMFCDMWLVLGTKRDWNFHFSGDLQ